MSYKLDRFGIWDINLYDSLDDVSTPGSSADLYSLAGGLLFDPLGAQRAVAVPGILTKRGELIGDSRDDIYTAFNLLRQLRGRRRKLERVMFSGDEESDRVRQWTMARCLSVNRGVVRTWQMQFYLPIVLEFQQLSPAWYGRFRSSSSWVLDDGYYLDDAGNLFTIAAGASTDVTVTNNGNDNVTDAIITVTVGNVALTGIRIVGPDTNIYYGGAIAPNTSLVIDTGAFSVKNDGAADYENFTLDPSHHSRYWLNLAPGNNTVTVQTTTVGEATESVESTIAFTYWEAWA